MKNEIIQIVTCDNYDGFQHLNFVFSQKKKKKKKKKFFKKKKNPRVKIYILLILIPFKKIYFP